jgi:membrane protein
MAPNGPVRRIADFWQRKIWQSTHLVDRSLRGWTHAVLRVISITWTVFMETKASSRAAALSFSSMLALGPLVAIAVLVAGIVLGHRDPAIAIRTVDHLLRFIAPQVNQFDQRPQTGSNQVNPQLASLVNGFIAGAQSNAAGLFGILTLIVILLFVINSIEDVFNEIWGVRRGRPWLKRILFYWAVLVLGALLFFAAIAFLGIGAFLNVFVGSLPFGPELVRLLRWSLPLFSAVVVAGVLTVFYHQVPNTRVVWRAALTGATVVALLLLLNNFIAFFYVRRVLLTKSLYGSLGILPVLMFGLYIFWFYLLIGGQISYAVQNARYRHSQAAWATLSVATRDRVCLVALVTICRRFQASLPPLHASELGTIVRVPAQILNESLNRMADMGLISPVPSDAGEPAADPVFQPSRPLNQITLMEFKAAADNLGDNPLGDTLEEVEPIVREFSAAVCRLREHALFQTTIEELLERSPKPPASPA